MAQSFTFPGNITVYVCAFTNAGYTQRLTITPPSGTAAVFSGQGEGNVPMAVQTRGFLQQGNGQLYFRTPSAGGTYTVAATANSSITENVQFATSTAQWPGGAAMQMVVFGSEDASDADFNDSVMICSWYQPKP